MVLELEASHQVGHSEGGCLYGLYRGLGRHFLLVSNCYHRQVKPDLMIVMRKQIGL